jgi:hypothetical protein
MILLFSGLYFPDWMLYLSLFEMVSCPILSVAGIYFLTKANYKKSTLVLSFIILFLFFVIGFFSGLFDDFVLGLLLPFGFAPAFILVITGLSIFGVLIGIVLNVLSVFGLVRLVERFFETRLSK